MKKLLSLLIMGFLFSCGNGKMDDNKTESPVTPPVDNVNGNIPDSTNTINLNQPLPIDSSNLKDSTQR
ncbi:MAG: hypothetical protein EOO14_20840 [Chitinophagaceae bacterium]|nr:MAG: hypothetical protein EOO14_20840 [Chitinophagaceae bacterium]